MKKFIVLIIFVASGQLALANNGTDRPTTTVTNYNDVLTTIIYPNVCRAQGIEGTVLVEVHLNKRGEIQRHIILESPCSDLTLAVEEALPHLDFVVPEVDGKAVKSKVIIPVDFRLTL